MYNRRRCSLDFLSMLALFLFMPVGVAASRLCAIADQDDRPPHPARIVSGDVEVIVQSITFYRSANAISFTITNLSDRVVEVPSEVVTRMASELHLISPDGKEYRRDPKDDPRTATSGKAGWEPYKLDPRSIKMQIFLNVQPYRSPDGKLLTVEAGRWVPLGIKWDADRPVGLQNNTHWQRIDGCVYAYSPVDP